MRTMCAVVVLAALVACSDGPTVRVVQSGAEVRGNRIGAAASVVVDDAPRGPVDLGLRFVDADGVTVGSAKAFVPSCGRGRTCPWGAAFPGTAIGRRWRDVADVRITILRAPRGGRTSAPVRFGVRRGADGTIRGRAPVDQGIVHVVSVVRGVPVFGAYQEVTPSAGRDVSVTRDAMPARDGERLVAFVYPGPVRFGD